MILSFGLSRNFLFCFIKASCYDPSAYLLFNKIKVPFPLIFEL